jgi:hypothetical protein
MPRSTLKTFARFAAAGAVFALLLGAAAGVAAPAAPAAPAAVPAAPKKPAPAAAKPPAAKPAAAKPATAVKATDTPLPDFSSDNVAWIAINSDFTPVPGGPKPVGYDPKHPFVRNDQPGQATYRVADVENENLKPWVKESLSRLNAGVLAGKIGPTPRWSCLPGGVPGFSLFVIEPTFIVQGPKEVLLIYAGNHEVRHVYLNVPHSQDTKLSWYGESVGHYEGDTLVVDTVGLSTKAVIDNYHTPHTDKLHVMERYHLLNDGKTLEVNLKVEDPGAFYEPWEAVQHYNRIPNGGPLPEENCSENNDNIFHLEGYVPSPEADVPDF